MDYKSLIKSRKIRFAILKFLSFVPDRIMLSIQYRIKLGRKLNWNNPKRFSEKLQLYKTLYRNPLLGQCVDKFEVRKYVTDKGFADILTDLYGIYDNVTDIDFKKLPNQFVIKTTDGGGGNNIIICKDKSKIEIEETCRLLDTWKNVKDINAGREWAYTQMNTSRYIVEEYLENNMNPGAGVSDYKFFCFQGIPFCVVLDVDRYVGHKRNFYNLKWENLNVSSDCPATTSYVDKPENFDKMIEIATKLSEDFPFVRVDLYNLSGKIYFGELTFYPWSGYVQYEPDDFDYLLGNLFNTDFFRKNV